MKWLSGVITGLVTKDPEAWAHLETSSAEVLAPVTHYSFFLKKNFHVTSRKLKFIPSANSHDLQTSYDQDHHILTEVPYLALFIQSWEAHLH